MFKSQSTSSDFCHPSRMGRSQRLPPGGVAALNHRLIAETPAGVGFRVTGVSSDRRLMGELRLTVSEPLDDSASRTSHYGSMAFWG